MGKGTSANDADKSVISKTGPDAKANAAAVTTTTSNGSKKSKSVKNVKKVKSADKSSKRKSKSADANTKKSKKKSASEKSTRKKSKSSKKHSKKSVSKDRNKDKSSSKKSKSRGKTSSKSKGKSAEGHSRHGASTDDGYKLKLECKGKSSAMTPQEQKLVGGKVLKVEATRGATAVTNEKAITSSGFLVTGPKLFSGEYSTVLQAKRTDVSNSKSAPEPLVVKVVNLAECSPRFRVNLLQNSVRIMRFISGGGDDKKGSGPLAVVFVAVYDAFLVSGVRLFLFMAKCNPSPTLYDRITKSKQGLPAAEVRDWCRSLVAGIHQLQLIGVAHRAIKLQHILFDTTGNAKLVGWSKSVFFFDPHKQRVLLQRKESRVRSNYHLPPEAFSGSYDPSRADIWSVGVALVAMTTKRYPFNVRDTKTKFSSQWRQFIKSNELNTYVRNLCHRTFSINPKRRIASADLLNEKYFSVEADKLKPLSCKADPNEVHEDLQVGGMSAIELAAPVGQRPKEKEEEYAVDWAEVQKEDTTGVDENATGYEGGAVGEEETLPADAENAAPEEAEAEAQPEEGEYIEATEDAQQTEAGA